MCNYTHSYLQYDSSSAQEWRPSMAGEYLTEYVPSEFSLTSVSSVFPADMKLLIVTQK